jgi:hypothetical protein
MGRCLGIIWQGFEVVGVFYEVLTGLDRAGVNVELFGQGEY